MQNRPLLAAAFILAGTAIVSFVDQFIRVIAEQSSLWTFHALRSAMILAVAGAWLAVTGDRVAVHRWRAVIARSIILSTALIIYFGALGFLSVAEAAAGLFTAPIWVLILSVGLFRLRIGPVRVAAVLMGFAGVLLVLSPDADGLNLWVFAPVLGGAFYALGAIATREWCGPETALALVLGSFAALGLWGLGGIAVLSLFDGGAGFLGQGWITPTAEVLFWCVVQAIGSLVAVFFLTRGYQSADASIVSVFEYAVLAFSALFGWLVWGDLLPPLGLLGLALIAAAGSLIVLRGRNGAPDPDATTRR
ncbi:carboxylate/amino acid/amine transporter [Jannaschia seosinensis]|uniref:Carboxylate/amino acid/amine transporter n=1 Tax=Jannaschia seosinensis TaxID=313367 RepID=A0A0M7B8C1_9RHOB|nr:DMT family transporter [Jannaschia seosinensis]CUH26750.1 carboxylate/amino acid/amine transporter [Jannaschia seosinensis]